MSTFPKPGDIFNQRYELLEVLGAGGLAVVFRAVQLDVGRIVALKILRPEHENDAEFKERFIKEARALSGLNHDGIVTIYHMGYSDDGFPYIAMELLLGKSLRKLLKEEQKLQTALTLRITRQLATTLAYVHQAGIVHRDIKPENILLVEKPEPDTVKLIDFGLVRFEKGAKLTATGVLLGSVSYMSTEQCQGKPIDQRSDIYSLTVCFYEMLAGKRPYKADSPVLVINKHLNDPIPRIDEDEVDRFHEFINGIISIGMAKLPEDRFQDMDEFVEALDALADKLETEGTARKRFKLHKSVLVAGFALAIFLAASFFVHTWNEHKRATKNAIYTLMPKGKIEQSIEKLKQKPNKTIKDQIALARLLLAAGKAEQLAEAAGVLSSALSTCRQNDKSLCLVLRAKARMKQKQYDAAYADFDLALAAASGTEAAEIRHDIRFERVLLHLKTRKFFDAINDYAQCVRTTTYAARHATLDELMKVMEGRLDSVVRTRYDILTDIITETLAIKPADEKEAEQLLRLSNRLIISRHKCRAALKDKNFELLCANSESILPKIKGHKKLKDHTRQMLKDISQFCSRDDDKHMYFIDSD